MPDITEKPNSKPWPPPPDLHSLQELVATADVDGFISGGAPADEYEGEADALFARIRGFSTDHLFAANLLPVLEEIWRESFKLSEEEVASKRSKLGELATQIERFFGPGAKPQVRGS